jgi:FlaA1/EpsC-like NDP-sugar epimerase
MNVKPVAVIDPDPGAHRLRIHDVKVHYAGDNPLLLLRKLRADLLIVPSGENLSEAHKHIVAHCRAAGMQIEQFQVTMTTWGDHKLELFASGASA